MIYCNVNPTRLNFLFSKNRRKAENRLEILFVHNERQRNHNEILEKYKRGEEKDKEIMGVGRYRHINFISIGHFADPDDWQSEWIEEGYYRYPRV